MTPVPAIDRRGRRRRRDRYPEWRPPDEPTPPVPVVHPHLPPARRSAARASRGAIHETQHLLDGDLRVPGRRRRRRSSRSRSGRSTAPGSPEAQVQYRDCAGTGTTGASSCRSLQERGGLTRFRAVFMTPWSGLNGVPAGGTKAVSFRLRRQRTSSRARPGEAARREPTDPPERLRGLRRGLPLRQAELVRGLVVGGLGMAWGGASSSTTPSRGEILPDLATARSTRRSSSPLNHGHAPRFTVTPYRPDRRRRDRERAARYVLLM